ncbi:hypothetical protein QWZ03_13700 [Chitinimonas viridis]|uniref:Uncharacterized protein n=1 Tax=Chitinimonas viridis TaxID=664880 RepID=A0ABT8B6D4_9NEIS|nr:hypothetical protein [Chitinimonas viridis]MDN3577823.1 hypothetical protein [Chitinimonas viridis]
MEKLHLSSTYSLQAVVSAEAMVAFNIGPDGVVYAVYACRPLDGRTTVSGWASSAKTVPTSTQVYRVIGVLGEDRILDILIANERFNIHLVQPLGQDILLACARSYYRGPDDYELNGRLYGRDGALKQEILLGDGIEDMQTTKHGEIWTSYFDEGIFGNYGWHDPIGSSGLIAWDALGQKRYEYGPPAGLDSICDCYALNVGSDDDVWCYYYTNFPLVHLYQKRIASAWHIPVRGSRAFAIAGGYALFAGSYDATDTLHLLQLLPEGKVKQMGQFVPYDEAGNALELSHVVGRGDSLWMLDTQGLGYKVRVSELLQLTRRRK